MGDDPYKASKDAFARKPVAEKVDILLSTWFTGSPLPEWPWLSQGVAFRRFAFVDGLLGMVNPNPDRLPATELLLAPILIVLYCLPFFCLSFGLAILGWTHALRR
jgi:hypothetical protein